MYIRAPYILKETNGGYFLCDITDEMLSQRQLQCTGEINSDTANTLINQLLYLNTQDPAAQVTLYINSPGGEVASGLAIYDVMQAVQCPIRTVCTGTAASMAAVLFAAGDQRELLTHSRVMIHDPLIHDGIGGNALKIRTISENLMRTREVTCGLLAKHTNHTIEEIYEKTAEDTYFYGQEAVEFGLADTVIMKI